MSWIDDLPGPEAAPGMRHRRCTACKASWVGHVDDGEWCPWCEASLERQKADERRLLLDPSWLRTDVGHLRYDDLSPVDRSVWDRTRGQMRGAHSVEAWVERLARAVEAGLVDEIEARRAIRRMRG